MATDFDAPSAGIDISNAADATAVAVMEIPGAPNIRPLGPLGSPATAVPSGVPAGGIAAEGCAHCQAPMQKGHTYCRRCGFYPTLNIFVDLAGELPEEAPNPAAESPKSMWQVWKGLVPRWAWLLIGGTLVLLAASLAARFLVPAGTPRAIWTYAQFGIGILAAICAHVACYMTAIMVNDTLGPVDIILKPFAIWSVTVNELPKSLKRAAVGTWGLAAALFAAVVVGGVRYDQIIDWGKVPPKKKLKPAVTVPVDAPADDKSLEEAMDEFTKNAGVTPNENKANSKEIIREKMVKCLIVGFTPSRETDFASLILAVEETPGKWRYAGTVTEGIPIDQRSTLNRRMRTLLRSTPVVPCEIKAFWLEPKLVCSIWYVDWTDERTLKDAKFDKIQPDFVRAKTTADDTK